MKRYLIASVAFGLVGMTALAQNEKAAPAAGSGLTDLRQKASYGIGVGIGKSMKSQGVDIDPNTLAKGIADAVKGTPLLTDEQIREVMTAFQEEMLSKVKKESEDFLAKNKTKKGVTTLPSGLQYEVIKEGTGKAPKATDTVTVHYEGTLINGTVFDSSIKRGEPASFPVGQVIKGWTEALQLMKEGAKWKLYIPSNLAYGENPQGGGAIRPHDALIFDVELLKVQ